METEDNVALVGGEEACPLWYGGKEEMAQLGIDDDVALLLCCSLQHRVSPAQVIA